MNALLPSLSENGSFVLTQASEEDDETLHANANLTFRGDCFSASHKNKHFRKMDVYISTYNIETL